MAEQAIPSIDVHVHYVTGGYRKAFDAAGATRIDGYPCPAWTPELHLEFMERFNIAAGVMAISSPGVDFGGASAAQKLARECNEEAARVVADHPTRFGFMGVIPVPDVDASLAEIEYAMDVLHADGIKLPTNNRGIYLGHESLDPIFAELSRRRAVVCLHPQKPSAIPAGVLEGFPAPNMEFLFDTTRSVLNMIVNCTLQRYPNIKMIVPHAGALLPVLAFRLAAAAGRCATRDGRVPDVYGTLKNMYYDLAGAPVPSQLYALLDLVGTDRLTYGSDWPHTPEKLLVQLQQSLLTTNLLTDEQRRAIFWDNGLGLFPRLGKRLAAAK